MASTTAPTGHFKILYFAAASSFTGKSSEHLPAPMPARALFAALEQKYPGIGEKVLSSCALTINLDYVDLDDGDGDEASGAQREIKAGDEVAIIPPVSSG